MTLDMNLKNCKKCGKVFIFTKDSLCPKCLKKETKYFKIIRNYLWDNPGATIEQIHEETSLPIKIIRNFVREGRFAKIN